jgi:hypothetical protein
MIYAVLAFVALVAAVLGLASMKPDHFRVFRQSTIQAKPDAVFALINDFHHWPKWSPWEHIDPEMKKTHSGAAAGQGAIYEWNGNNKVGQGRMEILESRANEAIKIKLDFLRPFEAHNNAEFTLAPKGDATEVTWAMTGVSPFVMKVMHVFVSMDSMVGKDFETGLANLKTNAEKPS